MFRAICLRVAFIALIVNLSLSATELRIDKLDFDLVEQPGGRDSWYEVAITFGVESGSREAGADSRFADDIVLELALATEVERRAKRSYFFYVSKEAFPTLEVGRHVVRFYLPPEITKRDRVRGEPYAYRVTVSSRGETLDEFLSSNLSNQERLAFFNNQAEKSDVSILRRQEDTPFAWTNPGEAPVGVNSL